MLSRCYGKLSVSFMYKPIDEGLKRKDSMDSVSSIETGVDASIEATKLSPSEESQAHEFVRTHFRNATSCDFCNKKVKPYSFVL